MKRHLELNLYITVSRCSFEYDPQARCWSQTATISMRHLTHPNSNTCVTTRVSPAAPKTTWSRTPLPTRAWLFVCLCLALKRTPLCGLYSKWGTKDFCNMDTRSSERGTGEMAWLKRCRFAYIVLYWEAAAGQCVSVHACMSHSIGMQAPGSQQLTTLTSVNKLIAGGCRTTQPLQSEDSRSEWLAETFSSWGEHSQPGHASLAVEHLIVWLREQK